MASLENPQLSNGRLTETGDGDEVASAADSRTFDNDVVILVEEDLITSASISPCGRDVVLASKNGLHIVDLDKPHSLPRVIRHLQQDVPADVQWSPFAARPEWICSTSGDKALIFNVGMTTRSSPIEHTLRGHYRTITDINFSAHHPDILATTAVDTFVHVWDLRTPQRPVNTFADFIATGDQVKWNRQEPHVLASSHGNFINVWDDRKGAQAEHRFHAHVSKVYGLDWNRISQKELLSCSLDGTIKIWNLAEPEQKLDRVINTSTPVWRARYTPFGFGVLAMPQRVDYRLHLYDRRWKRRDWRTVKARSVRSFPGHEAPVKEFLWRVRGGIHDGVDDRDFQLVSWGMDKKLRLHPVSADHLNSVGHHKGQKAERKMNFTRHGAVYKSYRETRHVEVQKLPIASELRPNAPKGLGSLVSAAGMSKQAPPGTREWTTRATGMRNRSPKKAGVHPVTWMAGVEIKRKSGGMTGAFADTGSVENPSNWDPAEALSKEIGAISEKYGRDLIADNLDINRRELELHLKGPWGPEDEVIRFRVRLQFPHDYPKIGKPSHQLMRTPVMSEKMVEKLTKEIGSIISHYHLRKQECLSGIVSYLRGERPLEDSLSLVPDDDIVSAPLDDSSSDDEGYPQGAAVNLSGSNVQVPVARTCGARWTLDGRLLVFMPSKPPPQPKFKLNNNLSDILSRRHRLESGRISTRLYRRDKSGARMIKESLDDDDGYSSSSSSSSSEDNAANCRPTFAPPPAWSGAPSLRLGPVSPRIRPADQTIPSTSSSKAVVSAHDLSEILPGKLSLANKYLIFGKPGYLCKHNAMVAREFGDENLFELWTLFGVILSNDVPLDVLQQPFREDPILVLAKRSVVYVRKKGSRSKLQFDDPPSVSNPRLRGRVKWGNHPFGGAWLIPKLFKHFEEQGDLQMLAMMACIFWEPAAIDGVTNALQRSNENGQTLAMKCPAFSLDYFASPAMAWSMFKGQAIRGEPFAKRDRGEMRLDTYGSAGSSNGPWGSDNTSNIRPVSLSTGTTPPRGVGQRNGAMYSFASSPDPRNSRPLAGSPIALRRRTEQIARGIAQDSEADIASSAPAARQLRWNDVPMFLANDVSAPSTPPKVKYVRQKRQSFAHFERGSDRKTDDGRYDDSSSDSDGEPFKRPPKPVHFAPNGPKAKIKVTLKNQNRFDDHAHAAVPLLDPKSHVLYAAYRSAYAEILEQAGLFRQATEMKKYNGLASYWPGAPLLTKNQSSSSTPSSSSELYIRKSTERARSDGRLIPVCTVCWEPVQGLHFSCGHCRKVAHVKCLDAGTLFCGEFLIP
ncbi:hypothetical protein K402DRAFT_350795 [Aulographum hederae CBS 113979]|uniref:RWD domain-containing protein n=1 Tax=Aulographum hederae CBS 113979 TaxID=1176131 RepID=A0A6G1H7D6_9PEZI|nr:hypothetical protein K402DRAFT_350795 [Aulographum hederae CBS 113979]